jgi:hypothetical protein
MDEQLPFWFHKKKHAHKQDLLQIASLILLGRTMVVVSSQSCGFMKSQYPS